MCTQYLNEEDIQYQLANLKQLTFEVTDACNLNCKYCAYGKFYNDYDKRKDSKMCLTSAYKLIDYLVDLWNSGQNMSANRNVYISFYGGEPLLNMPFVKSVVNYVNNLDCKHRNFLFSMTTNGLLLERNMNYLVANNFNLLISLDGNEKNNSYRVNHAGKNVYEDISRNIDLLQEKYPDYFQKMVNFNSVLHNRNSVEEIYNYFRDNYDTIPNIGELNSMGVHPDKVELFNTTYRNSSESLRQSENYEKIERDMFMRNATYQSLTTFIHQYSGFVFRNYNNLLFGHGKKNIPTGTCMPFSRRMFVTVNGKIMPCERIGQQFALGSINPDTGVDIDLKQIADKYNDYFNKLINQCNKCYKAASCIQCVFNLNDLDKSPICHGYTTKERFNKYKAVQMSFLRRHPEEYYRIMDEVITE